MLFRSRFATWSHRVLNEPDVGQRFIDRLRVLYSIPQGADRSLAMEISRRFAPLLIDQARNQIAMGDIQLAEQLIDQFFAEMPDTYIHYNIYSQPYLLKGFLRAERGDMAEAESYWRRGLWESYQATVPPYLRLNRPSPFGIFGAIDHWIMASLLGELSDQEADGIIKELFSRGGSEALLSQVTSTVEISPALMRDAWRSPRGRKLAKQMAYLNIEPMDYIQTPPTLLLYQKFRQDFFGGSPTEDQDQVTWDAVK